MIQSFGNVALVCVNVLHTVYYIHYTKLHSSSSIKKLTTTTEIDPICTQHGEDIIFLLTLFTLINPHLPSGPIHPYQLDESISNFRGV